MKKNAIIPPDLLYTLYLQTIQNVNFTQREVDVIACILNGRSSKKTSSFLNISPRTVDSHIRNISNKLECHSRESIIDFIEKSEEYPAIKSYYSALVVDAAFAKALSAISNITKASPSKLIYSHDLDEEENLLLQKIKAHLRLVIGDFSCESLKKTKDSKTPSTTKSHILYVLSKKDCEKQLSNDQNGSIHNFKKSRENTRQYQLFYLLLTTKEDCLDIILLNENCIYFQENYYLSFSKLLKQLFPSGEVEKYDEEITSLCRKNSFSFEIKRSLGKEIIKEKNSITHSPIYKARKYLLNWKAVSLGTLIGVVFLGIHFLSFSESKEQGKIQTSKVSQEPQVYSDLVIPQEGVFLDRSELIIQLNNQFKGEGEIQSVALVGPGGAGKTTLARQYAHQQKADVVWEINAETQETLKNSFEGLAESLSKMEDQKVLRGIQDIKNSKERESKILEFVKERLRQYTNWFLIYDNVEQFTDIQSYFPQDHIVWGQGKIILTTRNINIQNNHHIGHVVLIGELDQKQKLELFRKILTRGSASSLTLTQKKEVQTFLENIPPLPLDISVAAYYVKSTNLSYDKYLKNLETYNKDFIEVQKNLLKEAGSYLKTRYGIITLSLEQLIKNHKDFTGLLLFISLLDSQNIPRDLLNTYKEDTVVDNFIYHLKKYSLITANSFDTQLDSSFSIHRSTQSIILAHLIKTLNLGEWKNNKLLEDISNLIENYMTFANYRTDLFKIKKMLSHCNTFLGHGQLLNEDVKARINGELGAIYGSQSSYAKAKEILHESLSILRKNYKKNSLKIAKYMAYLGNIYRELGEYEKAKHLFEQSLSVYQQHTPKDYEGLVQTLGYLGITYKNLGYYNNSKVLLEQTLSLSKKYLPETHVYIGFILAELGVVYKRLGHYKQAKKLLEQSLALYRNDSKNHIGVSWVLSYLGIIHHNLGNYENAKALFEEGLGIYKQHFPENHMRVARMFVCLGELYRECGDYKQAKSLLEKGLNIYNKYFTETHLHSVRTSIFLGALYRDIGDFQKAKTLLNKSLVNFEKHYGKGHIETAPIIENLGQVYLLEGNVKTAEELLNQSLNIFQKNNHPDF